jgi:hypothetical protein
VTPTHRHAGPAGIVRELVDGAAGLRADDHDLGEVGDREAHRHGCGAWPRDAAERRPPLSAPAIVARVTVVDPRVAAALAVPLPHAPGARLVDEADPVAGVAFRVTGLAGNAAGGPHPAALSALSALSELAGHLAALPGPAADEHGVTHAIATPARGGRARGRGGGRPGGAGPAHPAARPRHGLGELRPRSRRAGPG